MPGLSLDAGALIAIERGDHNVLTLVERARKHAAVHVVPEVIAQVWRGGQRQARLAGFLGADDVVHTEMTPELARLVGAMCAASGHHDIVDVFVVLEARLHGNVVVTADADDLRRVDPHLEIIEI